MEVMDITIPSVRRPELFERCLTSFVEGCWGNTDAYRLLLNVDPVGPGATEDMETVASRAFLHCEITAPARGSLNAALRTVWGRTQSEFIFYTEDDIALLRPVAIADLLDIMRANPRLAFLQLPQYPLPPFEQNGVEHEPTGEGWYRRTGQYRMALQPCVMRGEFARRAAALLHDDADPETQFHRANPTLQAECERWEYGTFGNEGEPHAVSDMGDQGRHDAKFYKVVEHGQTTWRPVLDCAVHGYRIRRIAHPVGERTWADAEAGKWRTASYRIMQKLLTKDMTFVDAGGYVGTFALWAAHKAGRVFAFEPDPEAYRVLLRNIMLNETACRNVQAVLGCAISDQNGAVRLQNRGDYGSSKSRLTTPDYTASAPVACMTLSHALAAMNCPTPDFVKINVQGYEARLLRQAAPMLCEAKATVHVYVRPANWPDAALDAKALAYVLTRWPNVYTESGERISPAVITSPEWLAKSDYKLLASFKEWPVA